jgi:hypothetical protein
MVRNSMDLTRQEEIEEKLRQDMVRAWEEYKAATASEKAQRMKQYLEALRSFTKAISPAIPRLSKSFQPE